MNTPIIFIEENLEEVAAVGGEVFGNILLKKQSVLPVPGA
jgi:hypothetical protein